MKKFLIIKFFVLFQISSAIAFGPVAKNNKVQIPQANEVELKGFKLGMTEKDL